jgi:hypothetical protein
MWSARHPKLRVHTVVAILSIDVAATVSFSADCVRFGDRLGDLVETGVAVKDAAAALGMSGMSVLCGPACPGHPMGASPPRRGRVDRERIVVVFTATGSTKAATTTSCHQTAGWSKLGL